MKRQIMILMTMLLGAASLWAVPAHPGKVKVQQPDGSYVTIRLHGDEWQHFHATTDGYSVVKDSRGYYMYAELKDGQLTATRLVAHDAGERSAAEQAFLSGLKKYQVPEMSEAVAAEKSNETLRRAETLAARQVAKSGGRRAATYDYNNFKGLILLVSYNDQDFSRADINTVMDDMVNKDGYTGYANSGYGRYTGSVHDYFSDNSGGKFQPQFDVVGPVQINYSKYYAHGTDNVGELVRAAVNAADADVNYKDYDRDNDGIVDMVYFIFAGVGSNITSNDDRLIWPCASYFSYYQKDGVNFGRFALSTELTGSEDNNILEGIGTMCHEFSHVLGLPDFYDTDYEKSGGESVHPGVWSLMASGCYENNARTPVGYSLYERYSVGFFDEPEVINAEGSYTLEAVHLNGKGYRINTPVNNEFFLFENRQKNSFKWDASLPGSGMLVHRVDKTNGTVWYMNTINNNPSRNYYQVVRAAGDDFADRSSLGKAYDLFPGAKNVRQLHNNTEPANLKTWSGKSTKWGLSNIKMTNGEVTFDVGNTFELTSLSLPETASVGVGLTMKLEAAPEPDFAEYTLTWSSDKEKIATVDQEGNVKGIKAGTANITVTSNNGLSATCAVTVEVLAPIDVSEFKSKEEGAEVVLQLNNAEVLYVYETNSYVRDAKGTLMFKDVDLGLKKNDRVSGTVIAKKAVENNMIQAVSIDGVTNASGLTVTAGDEVQPREVTLDELTEADYADYVIVKAVQLERSNGVWAVSGDKRARLWNLFKIGGISAPTNVSNKFFDIEAIYASNIKDGTIINELEMLKSPTEVEATAIETVGMPATAADATCYNLQGQRVSVGSGLTVDGVRLPKGIYIVNGRKYVNK